MYRRKTKSSSEVQQLSYKKDKLWIDPEKEARTKN
jgi:hypothetical protein